MILVGTRKPDKEIEIFHAFARVCPLPIVFDTIEKRDPPEPDIRCSVAGAGSVAFELVELIDQGFAHRLRQSCATKRALNDFKANLPREKCEAFENLYGNALLYFRFGEGATAQKRKAAVPRIFGHLLKLPAGFRGDTVVDANKSRDAPIVITIRRGNLVGPILDVESSGWVGDPTSKAIWHKLRKSYQTELPLELLAYIDVNPLFPDDVWLPGLKELLRKEFLGQAFNRIWVYDVQQSEIKYSYPPERPS